MKMNGSATITEGSNGKHKHCISHTRQYFLVVTSIALPIRYVHDSTISYGRYDSYFLGIDRTDETYRLYVCGGLEEKGREGGRGSQFRIRAKTYRHAYRQTDRQTDIGS